MGGESQEGVSFQPVWREPVAGPKRVEGERRSSLQEKGEEESSHPRRIHDALRKRHPSRRPETTLFLQVRDGRNKEIKKGRGEERIVCEGGVEHRLAGREKNGRKVLGKIIESTFGLG